MFNRPALGPSLFLTLGTIIAFSTLHACGTKSPGAPASSESTDVLPGGSGGDVSTPDPIGVSTGISVVPGRGIYTESLDVVVEHPTATSIRYTLDGGDPRDPEALTAALPLTLSIDPDDITHRYVAPGVILRLTVDGESAKAASVVTHTYLFNDRVADLSPDQESPGGGWPSGDVTSGVLNGQTQVMDYGIE